MGRGGQKRNEGWVSLENQRCAPGWGKLGCRVYGVPGDCSTMFHVKSVKGMQVLRRWKNGWNNQVKIAFLL